MRIGARLHRARYVDQEQDGAWPQLAFAAAQQDHFAFGPDGVPQRALQVEAPAALGRAHPIAAAAGQPGRQVPAESRAAPGCRRPAAARAATAPRWRRGLPGLVDVVRQRRVIPGADRPAPAAPRRFRRPDPTARRQGRENACRTACRNRRCRSNGGASVATPARRMSSISRGPSSSIARRKARPLFRRDRKAVAAQQRDEIQQRPGRARQS